MGKWILRTWVLGTILAWSGLIWAGSPSIEGLLKPAIFKKVTQEREAMVHASLEDLGSKDTKESKDSAGSEPGAPLKRYSFYAAMQVREGVARTRAVLTDYALYAKMVPYVEHADFNPATHTLSVQGGIWMFKLSSVVKFEEKGDQWIHYRIIRGHFNGLEGDVFFESEAAKGYPSTLVYMRGEVQGSHWPPTFIIERGAEVVFGFTARKMRDYIESRHGGQNAQQDSKLPQPRSHL